MSRSSPALGRLFVTRCNFPNGKYRDQVDASRGAFNRLVSGPIYNLFGGALD